MAKITLKIWLEAVKLEGPYPKKIADRLGVTVDAFYKAKARHTDLDAAYETEKEGQYDLAESVIMKAIKADDAKIAMEFMKTKGKSRGYSTRVETTGADGGPIKQAFGPDLENMTDDALRNYMAGLIKTTTDLASPTPAPSSD